MREGPGATREALVKADQLSRSFGDRVIVRDCSLLLESGRIGTIVGSNGSGKTTLLRILAGVLAPSSGAVTVAGAAPGSGNTYLVSAGERMLNWRLTGRQNLEFYARVWGANGSALTRDVEAAADAVEGLSFLDQTVGSCSTGQRRRLMLAVALLSRAPVLLFDEPFADLDEDGRKVVCKVTEMWTAAGGVVISATPIEADAPPADVVFHLVDGKVEARS